jgi:hypothetical protein
MAGILDEALVDDNTLDNHAEDVLAQRREDHRTGSIYYWLRDGPSKMCYEIEVVVQARTYKARPSEDASRLTPNFSRICGTPPM